MAQSMEAEKYEALGVIGRTNQVLLVLKHSADELTGKGSFGIIRKVRRVADNHVRIGALRFQLGTDNSPDLMSQGNKLHQDGTERTRTASR